LPPPAAPSSRADDSARARALLEGTGVPAASEGGDAPLPAEARFVVQVGAYSDATALREARQRVEKLGLKTYTQVVDTESGKRTRVRVGPYASRDEADVAAAKIKRAGLPANILAL
jgi:DedD protein